MMVRDAVAGNPAEVLRSSSEQIRRAAALLSEIAEETENLGAMEPEGAPAADLEVVRIEDTIRVAQRSFAAALRLAQLQEDPDD